MNLVYADGIKSDVEQILSSNFEQADFEMHKIQLSKSNIKKIEGKVHQKFFDNYVYVWKIIKGESVVAVAILDNVYGKALPITFLTAFSKSGQILFTEIIKYREQYGGSVKSKKWLKQFESKNSHSDFDVGKDIQGISGATISVNSVTKGIQKSAMLFEVIKDEMLSP